MAPNAPSPSLPPLREVIAKYGLGASKALGQHFLLDRNITDKIARASGELSKSIVLEIGPGPGGLTRSLLALGAKHVIAIERDARFLPALEDLSQVFPDRLTVVHANALEVDEQELLPKQGIIHVIANLPYNAASPILVKWLRTNPWPPWYDSLTLMFQKEVADRIVAPPGTKTFGRLSVLAQWRCQAKLLFDVSARAFTPPPKIVSSVIRITPQKQPFPGTEIGPALEQITRAAFGQRRKMLRSSLRQVVNDTETFLKEAEIDPTKRAEQLSIAQFVRLAEIFLAR